jgi:hypothetical protein
MSKVAKTTLDPLDPKRLMIPHGADQKEESHSRIILIQSVLQITLFLSIIVNHIIEIRRTIWQN